MRIKITVPKLESYGTTEAVATWRQQPKTCAGTAVACCGREKASNPIANVIITAAEVALFTG